MFDVAAVEAGAWVPGPYGPGDQRGTFNEVTPEKTAQALALLRPGEPVQTYSLAETMGNGFPAWGDRAYEQRLVVTGYTPPDDFAGILTDAEPQDLGRKSIHEERVSLTYNMGTKINGLHHVGVADMLYNGFKGPEIAATWGTTHLGAETMGPIVTRGVVVDVVGWTVATGRSDRYRLTPAGRPVLRSRYRITVEDIEATLAWEGIERPIGPGDAVLLRTGWRELIELDPERYLGAVPPGPYLRECRYLAARRPALLASDTWNFETIDPDVVSGLHDGLPPRAVHPVRHQDRRGRAHRRAGRCRHLRVRVLLEPDVRPWSRGVQHAPARPGPAPGAVLNSPPLWSDPRRATSHVFEQKPEP